MKFKNTQMTKLNVSTTMVQSYWQQNSALLRKNRISTKGAVLGRSNSFGGKRKIDLGLKPDDHIPEQHNESHERSGPGPMSDYGIFRSPILKKKATPRSQDSTLLSGKKNLWQRFEDYFWLENHHYFYICCIHEYGPKCLRGSPVKLIIIRTVLLLCSSSLVAANLIFSDQEQIELTMINLYLCCVVTFLLLLVALQYHIVLKDFHIKIMKNDFVLSPMLNLNLESSY